MLRTTLVLIICGILLVLSFNPAMFTGGDNAQYITLAKSILQGNYRNLAFIDAPAEVEIPPGYPLMIAPLIGLSQNTFLPTKLLSLAMMLLGIYISLKLFDKYGVPMLVGGIFCVAMCANLAFSEFSHWTLTEAPYFALSLLGLYLFEKNYEAKTVWRFIGASAALCLSIYIRPVAANLILGAFVFLLINRMFKRAGIFVCTAIAVYGPWLLRNAIVKSGGEESTYLVNFFTRNSEKGQNAMDLGGMVARIFQNLKVYSLSELPRTFTGYTGGTGIIHIVLGAIATIVVVVGLVKLFKSKKSVIPYYLVCYTGMLLVYNPQFSTFRFLVPMTPFIMICIWKFLGMVKPIDIAKSRKMVSIIVASLILVSCGINYGRLAPMNIRVLSSYMNGMEYAGLPDYAWARFIEACDWIENNTPENTKLISRKPRMSYILSDRPGKVYPFTEDIEAVMTDIDSSGADYVILDRVMQSTAVYLFPTIQAYPQRFSVIYESAEPETYVLRILPNENAHRTERKNDE